MRTCTVWPYHTMFNKDVGSIAPRLFFRLFKSGLVYCTSTYYFKHSCLIYHKKDCFMYTTSWALENFCQSIIRTEQRSN